MLKLVGAIIIKIIWKNDLISVNNKQNAAKVKIIFINLLIVALGSKERGR